MIEALPADRLLARWSAELVPPLRAAASLPPLERYSREEIDAARHAWAVRVVDEYRSVVVLSELLALLSRAQAPFACLAAVQRLVADELRHTHRCSEALAAVDPEARTRIDLSDLGLPPSTEPPLHWAYEVVAREIVAAERESVVILRAYRDATTEPFLRAILQELLRDEVRHAAAGPPLAAALAATIDPARLRDLDTHVAALTARDVEELRRAYRASATGGPGRALGASIVPTDLGPPPSYDDWPALRTRF